MNKQFSTSRRMEHSSASMGVFACDTGMLIVSFETFAPHISASTHMTPSEARQLAAHLIEAADMVAPPIPAPFVVEAA